MFSDLILVVEGNELHVHKAILYSRSKVMAALLGKAFYEKDKEKASYLYDLCWITLMESYKVDVKKDKTRIERDKTRIGRDKIKD